MQAYAQAAGVNGWALISEKVSLIERILWAFMGSLVVVSNVFYFHPCLGK